MRADIIVVDFHKPHLQPAHNVISHLVYAACGGDVRDVIVDGAVVMRDRRILTVDEEEAIAKANESARRLIG